MHLPVAGIRGILAVSLKECMYIRGGRVSVKLYWFVFNEWLNKFEEALKSCDSRGLWDRCITWTVTYRNEEDLCKGICVIATCMHTYSIITLLYTDSKFVFLSPKKCGWTLHEAVCHLKSQKVSINKAKSLAHNCNGFCFVYRYVTCTLFSKW